MDDRNEGDQHLIIRSIDEVNLNGKISKKMTSSVAADTRSTISRIKEKVAMLMGDIP